MIEKQVTFEGILREEEEQSNDTARLQDYRVAAITKDATYILVDALPYDFIVTNVFYRITEAFDGTINLGTAAAPGRIIADADFVKTVGKRSTAKSIQIDAKGNSACSWTWNHWQDRGPCDWLLADANFALNLKEVL